MRKFAVFSGFLGSGKTSTMMALTEHYNKYHGKAAMITNDLGGAGLADHRLAKLRGCNASEITNDCICYKNEELMAQLSRLYDEGCELVISDIPGFGVGALEHVYHGLMEKFPGQCELAPFTVLVEPKTVQTLMAGFEEDLAYILKTQLVEADLILLNKCDTISAAEKTRLAAWLKESYPRAELICISALMGENLEALSQALTDNTASMHRPDIGYGGEAFSKIMGQVCEYNIQYFATVCCNDFDGNAYLSALAEGIKAAVSARNAAMPHMKLLAWEPEGEYAKADMMGCDRAVEINQRFSQPCTELAVVLNSSAFGNKEELDIALTETIKKISDDYQLELNIFKKELI